MLRLLRRCLFGPLNVTQTEARQIACDLCRKRDWKGDILLKEVHEGVRGYHIVTQGWHGHLVWISVDGYTGQIMRAQRVRIKRNANSPEDDAPGAATTGVPRSPYPPRPVARNANNFPE